MAGNELKKELVHHSPLLWRHDPKGESSNISQELNLRSSDGDIPPWHFRSKSISGQDSSLMREKSGLVSDNPHNQELNSRNKRSDRDILPSYVRADGSIVTQDSTESTAAARYKNNIHYLITYLIGLVAVKYQAKVEDIFEANPVAAWSCVAAVVAHSQIPLISRDFPSLPNRFSEFSSRVASASGVVLSPLSLISLLLPQLPGQILLYTSWALFVIVSAWPKLQSPYNRLLKKIKTVTNDVISFAKKFSGPNINSQQERPPV